MRKDTPEISDTIVAFDPKSLQRLPIDRRELLDFWRLQNDPAALKVVEALPDRDGLLDTQAVDRLLIACHYELQRMSEEFQHGPRVAEVLRALRDTLVALGVARPLRIVDIGCGTGYVVRWLTKYGDLGDDIALVGVDYHAALIEEARKLAAAENLACDFQIANAFTLSEPATIFISTGVLHHFRGDGLVSFFSRHQHPHTDAFVHFDFQPSPIAPLGAWLFHAVRMRQPLSKHDGVLSAIRSHCGTDLLKAARKGAPEFRSIIYGTRLGRLPFPRVFHILVGTRAAYFETFTERFAARGHSLGTLS